MITTSDSLQFLTTKQEHEFNILYADPPYALGSTVIVRPDGKVDYHKASDFMSKWEMPTGDYWEKWFKEAHRVLKNGGWLIMFGIDRQLLLFKYYALLAGFEEQQSLYWYFISNFPKATDLSKMLDKQAGVEFEVGVPISNNVAMAGANYTRPQKQDSQTELAKKYDGYKYSISPLKQTNETIMIFKKPSKTGSVLHDTLAFENGDTTINVSALDIDGNRVGTEKMVEGRAKNNSNNSQAISFEKGKVGYKDNFNDNEIPQEHNGRYPAQTFIDNQVAEILDEQSNQNGMHSAGSKREAIKDYNKENSIFGIGYKSGNSFRYGENDVSGASKILHKCNYEQDDVTLYHYEPKVSGSERNAGLGGFEEQEMLSGLDRTNRTIVRDDGSESLVARFGKSPQKNNHPTLKPIDLNYRILKLFKLPTDQKICYPFAGSGSEIIGGIKAGFENWVGCEINAEYVAIANARINYWKETMWEQQSLFDEVI